MTRAVVGLCAVALVACGGSAARVDAPITKRADDTTASFSEASPAEVGIDAAKLAALAEWVRDRDDLPIFSILISRDGKLVFELYTSGLDRDDAHYVMSVTKSFTSCLVGIAIDRGLLRGADETVADALPASLFADDADRARFAAVTLRDVLGMSALDAQVPPHEESADAWQRQRAFLAAADRVRFALTQRLLPSPGASYQYTDITPFVAIGAVEHAAHESGFDFAREALFDPLGFRNEEWMHSDASGGDNGAYGLRMRPIDMQKLGVLYLEHGAWNGKQIVSRAWVEQSLTPWIQSRPDLKRPNYGWYWWADHFGPWVAHVANGWKGQRIAVLPDARLVVTMTGVLGKDEEHVFREVMDRFVVPAVGDGPRSPDPAADARLAADLQDVRAHAMRIDRSFEPRMVPSREPKERRRPFSE